VIFAPNVKGKTMYLCTYLTRFISLKRLLRGKVFKRTRERLLNPCCILSDSISLVARFEDLSGFRIDTTDRLGMLITPELNFNVLNF
jgi:hypothetical protein